MLALRGVFKEDVLSWIVDPSLVPRFPHELHVRQEFMSQPVFVTNDLETPVTYSMVSHWMSDTAQSFDWTGQPPSTLRFLCSR